LKGNLAQHKLLLDQYQYDGLDTCALDGLCATACPVDINTGDLVKRLRRENHSALSNKMALIVARNFKTVEILARTGLKSGVIINKIFGNRAMFRLTGALRKWIPALPLWSDQLTSPPIILKKTIAEGKINADSAVVYFPACISRLLGKGQGDKKNVMETFLSVSAKAGIEVIVPDRITGSCCGQIFSSKGYAGAYQHTVNDIIDRLWVSSRQGEISVVTDVSSCAFTLINVRSALTDENKKRFDRLKIMDSVEYLHDMIIPKSQNVVKKQTIVLHPVCSLQKMHTQHKFISIARFYANEVTVPLHAGCCGMAGDRGFLFPELTQAATAEEAAEVREKKYDGYYSSTKTCEMAMSEAVKENYESVLYLVDEALS